MPMRPSAELAFDDIIWLITLSSISEILSSCYDHLDQTVHYSSKQTRYQQYTIAQLDSDDGSDEDEDMNTESRSQITASEASEASEVVKMHHLYEEQQDQGDQSLIQQLNYYDTG
ncbi:hypothetical protein PABG_12149 [Paracoccidioides brasiliensis Pb03]|nr:hypothetical protein PABG_12149 [Paracoccidioides brasiliensis Pb03]